MHHRALPGGASISSPSSPSRTVQDVTPLCMCCIAVGPQPDRGLTRPQWESHTAPTNSPAAQRHPGRGPPPGNPPGNRRENDTMAYRSVHRATGQLVKTCDEISDPESSAAFTSTRSYSGNAWRTTLLPERAELTKG